MSQDVVQLAPVGAPISYPPGFIRCDTCQDFGTDVSFSSAYSNGTHHPCRHCQPMRFLVWRLGYEGKGLRVAVDGVECIVILPPDGSSVVQPCEGSSCTYGAVLVQSATSADDVRWIDVEHVAILTPWEGV